MYSISLCKSNWPYVSIYNRARNEGISFRRIYLQLDEGTLRFNAGQVLSNDYFLLRLTSSVQGLQYFLDNRLLDDTCNEISQFIHHTRKLRSTEKRKLLQSR